MEPGTKRHKNDVGMATISSDHNADGNDVMDPTKTADEEYHGDNDDLLLAKIVATWKNSEAEAALSATVAILSTQIDKLIKEGVAAYHEAESSHNDLTQLQQEVTHKDNEIASLRAAEEKNTKALSVSTSFWYLLLSPLFTSLMTFFVAARMFSVLWNSPAAQRANIRLMPWRKRTCVPNCPWRFVNVTRLRQRPRRVSARRHFSWRKSVISSSNSAA